MLYLQGIAPQGPEIYFYMSLTTWSSVTIIFGYFVFKIKIFLLILVSSIFMKLAVSYKWLQYFVEIFYADLIWIRCLQDSCTLCLYVQ